MNQRKIRLLIEAGLAAGLLFLISIAAAQNAAPQPQSPPAQAQSAAAQPSQAQRLAPGSVIPVQLNKTVDAKKVKVGDQIVAKVTQDLKRQDGQVIVPKDTEVVGHVTEAQARTKEEKESQLGLAFDHATMKNGANLDMPMSIQAVIGPQNSDTAGSESSGGSAPSAAPSPSPSGGGMPSGGRGGAVGGGSQVPSSAPPTDTAGTGAPSGASRPPITANTQGVIGLKDMKLSTAADAKQGSVLTSDKSNVKLESGTFMLLKVVQ
ncbi:MAG TPA: hypothetical protein VKV39_16245 [Candidatus Sulfotelmatobacter sp.]|nr:hypothetical protein [Candidatus Sulfotelmatobacter sp.]